MMPNMAKTDEGQSIIALAKLDPKKAAKRIQDAWNRAVKSKLKGKAINLVAAELGVSATTVFRLKEQLGVETGGDRRKQHSGSRKKSVAA